MLSLSKELNGAKLFNRLVDDYQHYQTQDIYIKYMDQLTNANFNTKGESPMFEEMMERAKMEAEAYYTAHYAALLDTLNNKNEQLSSRVSHLENLLKQHNIQFD